MEPSKEPDEGLEQRLRNLIIANADGDAATNTNNVSPRKVTPGVTADGLPSSPQATSQDASQDTEEKKSPVTPRGSRKRLNQAQRRQLSTQLSIPIDTRAPPRPLHSAHSYASPPGYPDHQYPPGGQFGAQRPHSATFGPPNHPMASNPFPSQARHHQSLSHGGQARPPMDRHDWRQPHSQSPGRTPGLTHGSPHAPMLPRGGNIPFHHANRQNHVRPEELEAQASFLESLCTSIVADAEIEAADIAEKEAFRLRIQHLCREAISKYEREQNGRSDFDPNSVELRCFGSLSSGFATKASDMDLGLVSPSSHIQPDTSGSPIPRIIEKIFLDQGFGARLLTRTRVPIIKLCEKPPPDLRRDFIIERRKWEEGLPEDHDADEETQDDPGASPVDDVPLATSKAQGRTAAVPDSCEESGNTYEQKLAKLKQSSEKQGLPGYFGNAKGVLRKLGGRDLTHSNMPSFKPKDYQLLNDVALAFVRGLADEALKNRLLGYRSLSPSNLAISSNRRSLLGVNTQVEGEKMALLWESRELIEKDTHHEQQAQKWVQLWVDLQNKSTFGLDPLTYNKELHGAAEQLKKIPSIQVLILQQGQYETAALYYSRASKLMFDLGGQSNQAVSDKVRALVTRQYISGIYSNRIREQVEEFAKAEETATLKSIARRHKSLQLAHEFEKAVEKGLYDESSKADIKAYIEVLRAPMKKSPAVNEPAEWVIPTTTEIAALVSKIQRLADPSTLAPNQPRDPYQDRLNIPKHGAGVQCDINFSAHLALQNTLLLRCYSHADPRVRPMVLFVKYWAKLRGINSPYRGTLSSYGYVLMVLHYLVNVAQPFVCPNLQLLAGPPDPRLTPQQREETVRCRGRTVLFWRDEAEIQRLARENMINRNRDSVGHLLRGFFEFYAQSNHMSTGQGRGFDWGRDVLSLRTPGGLLTKHNKGWTGAKTVVEVDTIAAPPGSSTAPMPPEQSPQPGKGIIHSPTNAPPDQLRSPPASTPAQPNTTREVKEIRHRYLFAIEDPFELDHNVARTVTHNGIVAIRDEFRRAWRIIRTANKQGSHEELLQDTAATTLEREKARFAHLLDDIHGREALDQA